MRTRTPLCLLLLLSVLAACGDGVPPAHYDAFTLELVDLAEGARVVPGTPLKYRVHYVGDLARDLRITAVFTHEATGESASFSWSGPIEDTFRIDEGGFWVMRHAFLERAGRIRVQLQASLTATRTGSKPWVTQGPSVYVELYPSLDRVEVVLPAAGEPVPYGAPLEVRVSGKDLYDGVHLAVVDEEAGGAVEELARVLPFDGSQTSIVQTWPLRARVLERVGTHPLHLVARYGELERASGPLAVRVTHTVDEVRVVVRDRAGAVGPAPLAVPRLGDVLELGVRLSGTQLAGHTLTVNDGAPVTAAADQVELMLLTPSTRDFDDGEGRETYTFTVRSGGIERSASLTLQRWGIERCGWRASDGRPYAGDEAVNRGTDVVMRAELWGFPDTSGWLIFRHPRATFTVWERDPGGRPTPGEIDSLKNNDDEGDSVDADVKAGASEAHWTTEYDDEFDLLDLHVNAAEYYFEVHVEDQVCTSDEVLVY
ncbi:hypothetical protein FGE12_03985 [Aggregicoccus sp. 17bor-14]|uniref:hypothetical protein n=1 Tax=Myxococcaceae TaxID=31 RepID=UPI00129C828C|nr:MULTISPECIES: hypothetical protein [Myxococcaceae]MBF5041534.1 hypothetical protein [Simulacricoccus sp. 17bor-14]MRI87319.1 hypothetical protein [Aggregicoccus sp. 17bor-14]